MSHWFCFFQDKYLLTSMVMLAVICAWHGVVSILDERAGNADKIEMIVLIVFGLIYILYNVGFVIVIYLFVSNEVVTVIVLFVGKEVVIVIYLFANKGKQDTVKIWKFTILCCFHHLVNSWHIVEAGHMTFAGIVSNLSDSACSISCFHFSMRIFVFLTNYGTVYVSELQICNIHVLWYTL